MGVSCQRSRDGGESIATLRGLSLTDKSPGVGAVYKEEEKLKEYHTAHRATDWSQSLKLRNSSAEYNTPRRMVQLYQAPRAPAG